MRNFKSIGIIKYTVMEHDVEMLVSPKELADKSDGRNILRLFLKLFAVMAIVLIVSSVSILVCLSQQESCAPLQPVDTVLVTLVEADDYHCHDNPSCDSLLHRIEQEQGGTRFNFVIASELELYIGLGFNCRANPRLNELHIKLISPDLSSNGSLAKLSLGVRDLMEESVRCGHVLGKYSITYMCDGTNAHCTYAVEYMNIADAEALWEHVRTLTFHSPASETGVLLHKAFRWTPCGQSSHEAKNITKKKVVTLESLPSQSCHPYRPVDQVDIYFDEQSESLTCGDKTCNNVTTYIESHHDGFEYNFVIFEDGDLYVGLGFRCQANHAENPSLKIKVLKRKRNSRYILRMKNIIHEGEACQKILSNYSIIVHNEDGPDYNSERAVAIETLIKSYDGELFYLNELHLKSTHFNEHRDGDLKVMHHDHRMLACHRKNNSVNTETLDRLPIKDVATSQNAATTVPNHYSTTSPLLTSSTASKDDESAEITKPASMDSGAHQVHVEDLGHEAQTDPHDMTTMSPTHTSTVTEDFDSTTDVISNDEVEGSTITTESLSLEGDIDYEYPDDHMLYRDPLEYPDDHTLYRDPLEYLDEHRTNPVPFFPPLHYRRVPRVG